MLNPRIIAFLAVTTAWPAIASAGGNGPTPEDGWVAWVSWRQERNQVWMARADGAKPRRLTSAGAGVNRVLWAPDGRWLAYGDEAGRVAAIRPDGSQERILSTDGWPVFWLHDNAGVVLDERGNFVLVDPDTVERRLLFRVGEFKQFAGTNFGPNAMTHDNRYLLAVSHLFIDGYTARNGSFTSSNSAVIVDLLDKDKVYFFGAGCWPFTPPDGDLVFHICGAEGPCPTYPDVYRMNMADLHTRASYAAEIAHPDPDWGHEYNPRVSTDSKWVTYMASEGCHEGISCNYDIFVHPLGGATNVRSRVTDDPGPDAYPDMYVGALWQPDPTPRLLTTPNRVTFHAIGTTVTPDTLSVKIKNAGVGSLGAVEATIHPPVPWLALSTQEGSIELKVMRERGLHAGKNLASVTVTAQGASGGPVTVPVVVLADDSFPPAPPDAAAAAPAFDAGAGTAKGSTGSDGGCHCALQSRRPGARRGAGVPLLFGAVMVGLARRASPRREP